MLAADHRILKQMKPTGSSSAGLTPMLQGRSGDRTKLQMDSMQGMNRSNLKEIKEEKEDLDEKIKKNSTSMFTNLRGL